MVLCSDIALDDRVALELPLTIRVSVRCEFRPGVSSLIPRGATGNGSGDGWRRRTAFGGTGRDNDVRTGPAAVGAVRRRRSDGQLLRGPCCRTWPVGPVAGPL